MTFKQWNDRAARLESQTQTWGERSRDHQLTRAAREGAWRRYRVFLRAYRRHVETTPDGLDEEQIGLEAAYPHIAFPEGTTPEQVAAQIGEEGVA